VLMNSLVVFMGFIFQLIVSVFFQFEASFS